VTAVAKWLHNNSLLSESEPVSMLVFVAPWIRSCCLWKRS